MQQLHRSKSTSARRFARCRTAALGTSLVFVCTSLAHAQRFGFPEELVAPPALADGLPFAVVDWDGDLDLDFVTAGAPGVLLNDGNGLFTRPPTPTNIPGVTQFPLVGASTSVFATFVAVDADQDGNPDLFGYGAGLQPLLGRGDGAAGFLPGIAPNVSVPALPVGSTAVTAMVAADFTGDGVDDVVLSVQPIGLPVFFRGLASGGFVDDTAIAFPTTVPATLVGANQLAAVDADVDGLLDLVTAEPLAGASRRQLFLNTGGGVFGTPPVAIGSLLAVNPTAECFAIGDFDGNPLPDAVFCATASAGTQAPIEVVLDIAFVGNVPNALGSAFPSAATFLVGSIPTSAPLTPNPLLGPTTARAFYLSHAAAGVGLFGIDSMVEPQPLSANLNVFADRGLTGDLDGDGDEDLAAVRTQNFAQNLTRLVFNSANGLVPLSGTSDPAPAVGPNAPAAYRFGDGDGDGDLDLFTVAIQPTPMSQPRELVAANDGDGRFAWTQSPQGAVAVATPLLVTNLDGNAFADTVSNIGGVASFTVDAMTPTAAVGVLPLPPGVAGGPSRAAAPATGGDFAAVFGTTVAFYPTVATPPTVLAPVPLPFALIMGLEVNDVDGDGADDVVFSSFSTVATPGVVYVAFNNGTTAAPVFAVPLLISTGVAGSGGANLAIGDLDGNGLADVVAGSDVYLQGPARNFVVAPRLGTGAMNPAVFQPALGDADGDGDLDVFGNSATGGTLFLNDGAAGFTTIVALPTQLSTPPAIADVDFDGDPDYVSSNGLVVLNLLRQVALGLPARPGRACSVVFYREAGAGTWFNYYTQALSPTAVPPLIGSLLVNPYTAILPGPLVPSEPVGPAVGAPLAVESIVDMQTIPPEPLLDGWFFYVQGGVSGPTSTDLYLTGRRTITIRDL